MHRFISCRRLLAVALLICTASGYAGDFSVVREKLQAAMAAQQRPAADLARDKNRLPVETLEFFGLRDDAKVVELMPGGGWYTQLLAPVLRDQGDFYVAYATSRVEQNYLGKPGFDRMKVLAGDARIYRPDGTYFYVLENPDLGVQDADLVLTFRNYHNFDETGRMAMNRAAFNALRPGGIYGVVDHTRRHMERDNHENRRRVDPVLAIKEIQAAGFELVDYSPLHFRADDELRYEVGRKTVTGNTDRWTLKFRKPVE